MKHEIKHDSWHMWLANFTKDEWTRLDINDTVDICTYLRLVVVGFLRVLLLTLVAIALGGWVLYSAVNLFGWVFLGWTLEPPAVVMVAAFMGVAFLLAVAYGKIKWDDYQRALYWKRITEEGMRGPKKPGFLTLVRKKFKEKTCFKLEIK